MEIIVRHPDNFIQERQYCIEILFGYFENIELNLIPEKRENYHICVNQFEFIIEDHFWNNLSEQNLDSLWAKTPSSPAELKLKDFKSSIITMYGNNSYLEDDVFYLESDIIAATFFLLTRWEEWISKTRDKHDRFPDKENYLIRNGIYKRAVVNEYIDFLKELIEKNINSNIVYTTGYKAFITHDVDELYRFKPSIKWIKAVASEIILRKNPISALKVFFRGLLSNLGLSLDDSQTFDYLMDISEKNNLTSYFYFIPGESGEKDFRYSVSSKPSKDLITKINKRGHVVGIHPSYRSKEQKEYFNTEVNRLNALSSKTITEGRHHYLRMNYPETMDYWEDNQLKTDSSLGFIDHAGFRAGMCFEYPVYNLNKRQKMNLIQRPLITMEVALNRNNTSYEEFKKEIKGLVKTTRKHQGNFVFLWHNNNINHPAWIKLGKHYEEIIQIIAEKE